MRALLTRTLKERRLNLAAGALILWVALGPWVWGYATSPAAVASHVFFIFAFGPLTLLIAVLRPAAYVLLAAGLWLALSPWVLGYATNHTAWLSELVTGALLIILAAHAAGINVAAVVPTRRRHHRPRRQSDQSVNSTAVETAGSRL
jgi:SPW repeat